MTFSQPIDPATVQNMDNYYLSSEPISGSGEVDSTPLQSVVYDAATPTARVMFAVPLNHKKSYALFGSNLKDAAGNGFAEDPLTQSSDFLTVFQFGHTLKTQNEFLGPENPVMDGVATPSLSGPVTLVLMSSSNLQQLSLFNTERRGEVLTGRLTGSTDDVFHDGPLRIFSHTKFINRLRSFVR